MNFSRLETDDAIYCLGPQELPGIQGWKDGRLTYDLCADGETWEFMPRGSVGIFGKFATAETDALGTPFVALRGDGRAEGSPFYLCEWIRSTADPTVCRVRAWGDQFLVTGCRRMEVLETVKPPALHHRPDIMAPLSGPLSPEIKKQMISRDAEHDA